MIKINLALRKQAAAIESRDKGGGGLTLKKIDLESLKDPQVRKIALAVIVAVMGWYLLDGYKDDQLKKLDLQQDKVSAEVVKAKAELAKTAGYDALKKQFEADEDLIKTKLSTIQKLIADRQLPPKILLSVSSGIPKDVWLTNLDMTQKDIHFKGLSLGFDPITDFMKAIGDNELMSEVKLDDSKKGTDPIAGAVETFELEAKRK